jgi:hypothetical protein
LVVRKEEEEGEERSEGGKVIEADEEGKKELAGTVEGSKRDS